MARPEEPRIEDAKFPLRSGIDILESVRDALLSTMKTPEDNLLYMNIAAALEKFKRANQNLENCIKFQFKRDG